MRLMAGGANSSAPQRSPVALVGLLALVAALTGVNLVIHLWHISAVIVAPITLVVLLVAARGLGATWDELGLGPAQLRSGVRWGGGAIALVAFVYAIAVLTPLTRPLFEDQRYHTGVLTALVTAFVSIPLGTVLFEEIVFRGILWALLGRLVGPWLVLGVSSVLFGLWHVLGAAALGTSNAGAGKALSGAGTWGSRLELVAVVAFTTLGGVVLGEVRRRSGSVVASIGLHWATNALGVLFGLFAWSRG